MTSSLSFIHHSSFCLLHFVYPVHPVYLLLCGPAFQEPSTILQLLFDVRHFQHQSFEVGQVIRLADGLPDFGEERLKLGEDYDVFRVTFEEELLVNPAVIDEGGGRLPMRGDHAIKSALLLAAQQEANYVFAALRREIRKE